MTESISLWKYPSLLGNNVGILTGFLSLANHICDPVDDCVALRIEKPTKTSAIVKAMFTGVRRRSMLPGQRLLIRYDSSTALRSFQCLCDRCNGEGGTVRRPEEKEEATEEESRYGETRDKRSRKR